VKVSCGGGEVVPTPASTRSRIVAGYFSSEKRGDQIPNQNQRRCDMKKTPAVESMFIQVSAAGPGKWNTASRHPKKTEKMLNDERHVKADDHEPELPLPQSL